jgi:hypothetical protein
MYTDLYDFCFCLSNKIKALIEPECRSIEAEGSPVEPQYRPSKELTDIEEACDEVMKVLAKENPKKEGDANSQQFIVAADSLGPAFQYSRGLSIYFPWSEPSKDSHIMSQYARYRFSMDIEKPWVDFLHEYFAKTIRCVSSEEEKKRVRSQEPVNGAAVTDKKLEEDITSLIYDIASLIYNGEGTPDLRAALAIGSKSDPMDKTGGDYEPVSIKNFPRDIRPRRTRMREAVSTFPVIQTFGLIEHFMKNGNNGKNGKH